MANICEYKVIVKGKKNACYAFLGSMSALEEKSIVNEFGTYDDYTLFFEGSCKWSVDSYCDNVYEGETPITLPEDANAALELGESNYWYHTVQERSKMFGVEVLCNSCDIDEAVYENFEHYENGNYIGDECPEDLLILGGFDDYDDIRKCYECGCLLEDGDGVSFSPTIHYCQECYDKTYLNK